MYFRPAIFALLAVLFFTSGTGCQKSEFRAPAAPPTVLSPDTIASVHWLGKKRLGITAGAYYFARIWQQPQSAQLERQTLVKLATAADQWLPGGTNLNSDARSRLWWLFSDILQEESYLEIRLATNSPSTGGEVRGEVGLENSSIVFAILLNKAQIEQWRTNLPVVLEPLTGARAVVNPQTHGWLLQTTNALIQFSRVGDWIIVAAGLQPDSLAGEITTRIHRDGVPFVSAGTNLWLEASLNLPRVAAMSSSPFFPLHLPLISQFSTLNFSISGDGGNVITRAKLALSQPLSTQLPPWRLPVDLMREPLASFTAVRGLQPLLADWPVWRDLQIGTAPDQLFSWSLSGSPYQVYLAAPLPDATSQVASLTDHLVQRANPWLAANGYVSFDRAADANGVTWGNLPDIKPFIKSVGTGTDGWLFAGLQPDTNNAATPPPAGMIQDVLRRTNLVYYDWEVTGPRLQPCLQLNQTVRLITRQPQISMDSASIQWLGMLIPRLGTSATIINRIGPAEFTLYRRSTLGLTAPELHLLIGWLESPQFPR